MRRAGRLKTERTDMERDTKTKTITVTVEVRDEWEFPKFERDHYKFGECVSCVRPARLRKHSFVEHVFDGSWHSGGAWESSDPPPEPVRGVAEELYWSNKTLAENEFRDSRGDLWQFKDPSFDSLSYRVFEEDCSGSRFHWTDWTKEELEEDGEVNKAALAWHRRAYTLAPDEARNEHGIPVKMTDGEVRDPVTQRAMRMNFSGPCVNMQIIDGPLDAWNCMWWPGCTVSKNHPCSDQSQLVRVLEFYEMNKGKREKKQNSLEDDLRRSVAVEQIKELRILISDMFQEGGAAARLLNELEEIVRAKG